MRVVLTRVKLLEPLMLRGPGEFDPSSRGVYAYASSEYLPSPATIVGAFISSFHLHPEKFSALSWQDLLKSYSEALDDIGVEAFRGFHICKKDNSECYVPLLMGFKRPEPVSYKLLESLKAEFLESIISCSKGAQCPGDVVARLRAFKDTRRPHTLKPIIQGRVGIALMAKSEEGPSKTAREGYIYTAEYMSYPDTALEIKFNAILKDNTRIPIERDFPVKIGGEQRIAKVRLEEREDPVTVKLKLLGENGYKYLLLTSPAPLDREDLKKVMKEKEKKTIEAYIGRTGVIGLGYSLALKKRKPLYAGLLEGTIVKVEKAEGGEETLRYGLYGILGLHEKEEYKILGRMGYATVIPIA